MAIQRRGQGGGSPGQELRHFTDREDVQAVFAGLLDRPAGADLPVLMYYGVGGMGKSWLLKKLRADLADRPGIPSALIDLEPDAGGAAFHRDSAALLAKIWREFDVECPRFELAFSMMRFKQGAGDKPLLKHSGQASVAWDLVAEGGNALLSDFPGGNVLVWLGKKVGDFTAKKLRGTALAERLLSTAGNEDYVRLGRMSDQEIYPLLAERLGQDLDERLPSRAGKACRAVVFLDTFEALRAGAQGDTQQQLIEDPIRQIYRNLTCVLLVIAGRDRLTWDEVEPDWADPASLEQHLLGGLSRHDASAFLEKCGIAPGPLVEAILRVCPDEDTPGEEAFYPFSLGLCADTVVAERHRGREPDPATFDMAPNDYGKLAQRFLKSLHDKHTELWITTLAQTPRFDEAAARHAFSPSPDVLQDAAWENLRDYSFVQDAADPGWFRLHSRMSDALRSHLDNDPEASRRSHEAWRDYWRSRSREVTDEFAPLAWSHDYALDPDQARREWDKLAERARTLAKMAWHQELLDWWSATKIEGTPPANPSDAASLVNFGAELNYATLGNLSANNRRAIACYEAALRVYTEAEEPADWATTQNNLGIAYQDLPTGDRSVNLGRAVACYEAALRVRTEAEAPADWAMTQNNLGIAYADLPTGDRSVNLGRAVACYEAALRVRTEAEAPADWAMTQNNLGIAYQNLPTGDRGANLGRAVACYEAALRVYTEAEAPADWAMTQNNLGIAYADLPTGDRSVNLGRAVACYEAALRVYTEAEAPADWAMTQNNLGIAYRNLPTGDRSVNLGRAVACYEAALRVRTEAEEPADWAMTQNNLGIAYADLPTGDRSVNLGRAVACYEAALRVRTEAEAPADWAMTQNNLGIAYRNLPTGDRSVNLGRAVACYEAALRVYTEEDYPYRWSIVQSNLDAARSALGGDPADN